MNETKEWWKSKTIIIAGLQLMGTALAAYMTGNPTWVYGGTAKSLVDILIRLNTDTSVGGAK